MARTSPFTRLPGRAGILSLHTAHLGPDHLLAVQTILGRERYRRCFFRDITAFSIHRNSRHSFQLILLGAFLLVGGALAWERWRAGSQGWFWFLAVVDAALVLLLARELALGATCACCVRTAVQTVELPSLNRVRRALRARTVLRERIHAAQGAQTPTATAVPLPVAPPLPIARPFVTATAGPAGAEAGSPVRALQALGATAAGALAAAGAAAYDYVEPAAHGSLVSLAGALAALGAALCLLIFGRGGALGGAARAIGWAVPGVLVLGGLGAYVALIAVIATDSSVVVPGQTDVSVLVTTHLPGDHLAVDVLYLGLIALFLLIAVVAGILWVAGARPRRSPPPVSSS